MIYDPEHIRPKRDWALVLTDRRKVKLESGIFLPPSEVGVEKVMERSGIVLRLGPGERAEQVGIAEGDKIVFRGFLKHANPVDVGDDREVFLMDVNDILAVTDGTVEVGAFSRPAMTAVESVDDEGNVKMKER